MRTLRQIKLEGVTKCGVEAFLKTEALLKLTCPRIIQSRAEQTKLLTSPKLHKLSDRIYGECKFMIKTIAPELRG
jgi:hypothetical protein